MGHLFASDGPERLPEIIVFAAQQPIIYFMNPRQAFCNRVTNCLLGLAKSRLTTGGYQNLAGRPRDPLGSISHPPAAQLARSLAPRRKGAFQALECGATVQDMPAYWIQKRGCHEHNS
jgi:hypothetical protein